MFKPVNIHQPYVYFDYLQETHPFIWDAAVTAVKSIQSEFNSQTAQDRIQNAIIFLYTVASTQRKNEINFIQTKINEMLEKNDIKDEKIIKLQNDLKNMLNKIPTEGFNYHLFTNILNEILSIEEDYKARLNSLLTNIEKKEQKEDINLGYLENIGQEFKNTLNFLQNGKKKLQKSFRSYSVLMPYVIYDYIQEKSEKLNFETPQELAASLLKIQIDFRKWMEKQSKLKGKLSKDIDVENRIKELKTDFKKFIQQTEGNNDKFDQITSQEAKRLAKIFKFSQEIIENKRKKPISFSPNISNINFDNDSPMFILSTDIKSTRLAEIMTFASGKIAKGLETGYINMGADALLGHLYCNYDLNEEDYIKQEELLDTTINDIQNSLEDFSKQRTDRKNYLENNRKMNERIEETLKKLDESGKQYNTNFFIIHESTKYYETIEQGASGRRSNGEILSGFSGRTMVILNYIDTMRNIGLDFGIDPDSWYFAALNLNEHSPAKDMKLQLEYIFCIAASLIMFDDTVVIAKEAIKELEFSNVTNLHLYNLQGLYFPASYIIQETADYLKKLSIEKNNMADVSIIVPSIEDYTKLYEKGEKKKALSEMEPEERWEKVKSFTSSETKVSIHFFLNFQNFISNMNS